MTRLAEKEIQEIVRAGFGEILIERKSDRTEALTADTVLLESGLDSLGFAILVSRLEDELGYDPFSESDEPYYPQTFGDFVRFYYDNQP